MVAVTVIVPEHPSMIHGAYQPINVGEAVLNHFAILVLPYFLFERSTSTGRLSKTLSSTTFVVDGRSWAISSPSVSE